MYIYIIYVIYVYNIYRYIYTITKKYLYLSLRQSAQWVQQHINDKQKFETTQQLFQFVLN